MAVFQPFVAHCLIDMLPLRQYSPPSQSDLDAPWSNPGWCVWSSWHAEELELWTCPSSHVQRALLRVEAHRRERWWLSMHCAANLLGMDEPGYVGHSEESVHTTMMEKEEMVRFEWVCLMRLGCPGIRRRLLFPSSSRRWLYLLDKDLVVAQGIFNVQVIDALQDVACGVIDLDPEYEGLGNRSRLLLVQVLQPTRRLHIAAGGAEPYVPVALWELIDYWLHVL